jgi:hypothetical protein
MGVDRTGSAPSDDSSAASRSDYMPSEPIESIEVQLARANRELDMIRVKHREMMELLGTDKPEELVHDLRNVLNELHLLRLLANSGSC